MRIFVLLKKRKDMVGKKSNGKYYGEHYGEGVIFKDKDAFLNRKDEICYVAEAGFDSGADETNWVLTEAEARAEVEKGGAETYNSMFDFTKQALIDEFGADRITDEFVAYVCEAIFDELEWTCYSTLLEDTEFTEDLEYWETTHKNEDDDEDEDEE